MPLDVRIISGGSTYYLVNSSGTPTAGGSTTGASTTPYSLEAAEWTQTAAPRQVIYSGGPPFRVGSSPLYVGYGNVTETLGVGISASSADNMASLIRTLRRILNTAIYGAPALLYWLPSGATSPVYFEIYSGDVQEVGDWNNPSAGFTQALMRVTITRSAVGGRLSSGETLINASAVTNNSGATNVVSLGSSGSGDLVNDGSPLNVTIDPVTSTDRIGTFRVATVNSRSQNTTNTGTGTSSTTSVTQEYTFTLNPSTIPAGCKLRFLLTFSSTRPTHTFIDLFAQIEGDNSLPTRTTVYQISSVPASVSGASGAFAVDLGGFDASGLGRQLGATSLTLYVFVRWNIDDGVSTTITRSYLDLLQAYTFCQATFYPYPPAINSTIATIFGFAETSNIAALPLPTPQAWIRNSAGTTFFLPGIIRGTIPRYIPGASLYVQWGGTDNSWTSSQTATLTATHAPLYLTLRGAG